ncbi:MAG TPA: hypothetical protein VL754_11035 [Verrucomicrobiae bacterium]|jgi:hypothetical protein|nr:hypothetical protein [Verrucomicrobiae bacterium]
MSQPSEPGEGAAEADPKGKVMKRFAPLSLFASPRAPGETAKDWDAVLRCHSCSRRFTIRSLPLKRIALVPQIASCPHCDARSSTAAKKLHHIVDLRQAKD